jgi:hypothetical protein
VPPGRWNSILTSSATQWPPHLSTYVFDQFCFHQQITLCFIVINLEPSPSKSPCISNTYVLYCSVT